MTGRIRRQTPCARPLLRLISSTTWTRYTPRETASQQHLPPSLCRSLFLALLRTRHIVSGRRSSLPSACCCRFEIEISPSRWILDTHVSLLLFSLSPFFSPFFFLFFFFLTLSTRYWILDTGRGRICGFLLAMILDYSQSRPLPLPHRYSFQYEIFNPESARFRSCPTSNLGWPARLT